MSERESEHHNPTHALTFPDLSGAVPTSAEARAKRRIAALEEELQMMQQEKGTKQRFVTRHLTRPMPLAYLLTLKERQLTMFLKAGRFAAWLFYILAWKI
jgi:hypothetical protein